MRRVWGIALGVAAVACSPVARVDGIPAGTGPLVGVYKASIEDGHGATRRAGVSLWAERPDRIHAELHGAVGGVTFILDAGAGAACIVDVDRATAYVGRDEPGAIESLVGVRVSAADAVAALLTGSPPVGLTVAREGRDDGSLPDRIRIVDGLRSITLTRVRFVRGSADPATLGTGAPPPRLTVRPIENLEQESSGEPGRTGGGS